MKTTKVKGSPSKGRNMQIQLYTILIVVVALCLINIAYIYFHQTVMLKNMPEPIVVYRRNETRIDKPTVVHSTGTNSQLLKIDNSANGSKLNRSKGLLQNGTTTQPTGIPYEIRNHNLCKRRTDIEFIVVVYSATDHFTARKTIRRTWANVSLFRKSSKPFELVFLLGTPTNHSQQQWINKESSTYGDIVQGMFLDTYYNLTYKAVLGLQWVTQYCPDVQYVLKVDDDVSVNVFRLFGISEDVRTQNRTMLCYRCARDAIDRNGKWKTNLFPGLSFYPFPFCKGFFVLISRDVIHELYHASKHVPYFPFEDVYFTGMLTSYIGNVTIKNIKQKLSISWLGSVRCFNNIYHCNNIASVFQNSRNIEYSWIKIVQKDIKLAEQYMNGSTLKQWTSQPQFRLIT